ncbi:MULTISPECIES: DUF3168 domain-containing protein [unclassified Meridianimarinicoccus]|uniref:DUF3168 domain-containing protein n=1 Tax=unclassified Meridianimarinicoccus TaxID=2923344 RepID=UPI00186621A1|nr:DUF3168 domain-containing protein [Fluviibacterium sp. MJW13]
MSYTTAPALQAAIYGHLTADAALAALVGPAIFDAPPDEGALPATYVLLGDEEARDRSDKGARATMYRLTLSVVTDAAGFHRAKQVAAAVDAALTGATLNLGSGHLVAMTFERARARRTRNASGRRIDLRFRALVDETP